MKIHIFESDSRAWTNVNPGDIVIITSDYGGVERYRNYVYYYTHDNIHFIISRCLTNDLTIDAFVTISSFLSTVETRECYV